MGIDEAVWASVRRAHEDTIEPAVKFCRRLGVSTSAYYNKRKREGWAARPVRSKTPIGDSESGMPDVAGPPAPSAACCADHADDDDQNPNSLLGAPQTLSAKRLTGRLYTAIDNELKQLETGASSGRMDSVADMERRTRTLMNMIRSLEKVLELDTDKRKAKPGHGRQDVDTHAKRQRDDVHGEDAGRIRQDIAERLKRLHEQWSNTTGSGGSA